MLVQSALSIGRAVSCDSIMILLQIMTECEVFNKVLKSKWHPALLSPVPSKKLPEGFLRLFSIFSKNMKISMYALFHF